MLRKVLGITPVDITIKQRIEARRELIRKEAKIGTNVFGSVPLGHKRDFFCLDTHTWVWHEEWIDNKGYRQVLNTCYTVRPSGVLKSQNNGPYQALKLEEAINFRDAVRVYYKRVLGQLYNQAV